MFVVVNQLDDVRKLVALVDVELAVLVLDVVVPQPVAMALNLFIYCGGWVGVGANKHKKLVYLSKTQKNDG